VVSAEIRRKYSLTTGNRFLSFYRKRLKYAKTNAILFPRRLNTLEACYTDTYCRYQDGIDQFNENEVMA